MTTHEKTRLIELLTSGDEQNILMAKEICEKQKCMLPISHVISIMPNNQSKFLFYKLIFGFKDMRFYANSWIQEAGFPEGKITIDFNEKYHEAINNYYAQHLQSSE